MVDRTLVSRMLEKLHNVELELVSPEVLADTARLRAKVREHAALKILESRAAAYLKLKDDLDAANQLAIDPETPADLCELAREEAAELAAREPGLHQEVLAAMLPPDPVDARNAVFEIRAGTGGGEAALFAGDLFRMYCRYADGRGWKLSVLDASESDLGGYKEILFTLSGENVYGALRYEGGGHRVQRVPITEAQGRVHTSAATVAVFPEADEEDDIHIPAEELRVDIFCAGGKGGQSVNTTYSAIRVTHLPTGLVAQCQDERSQARNKEKAMAVLKARLLDQRREAESAKMGQTRRDMIGSGDRSQRVRTYNFPQNRLTDHRVGLTLYSLDRVSEGGLDGLLSALSDHAQKQRLAAAFGFEPPKPGQDLE
jgi:peptide chain release factor 1